jgi:hypothetical protein
MIIKTVETLGPLPSALRSGVAPIDAEPRKRAGRIKGATDRHGLAHTLVTRFLRGPATVVRRRRAGVVLQCRAVRHRREQRADGSGAVQECAGFLVRAHRAALNVRVIPLRPWIAYPAFMRRTWGLAIVILGCVGQTLHSQRPAQEAPIPVQEQFVPRNDLTATLRLVTGRVQIDELPKARLTLKNVGTRRLLIRRPTPDDHVRPNPHVEVYTGSGERLYGPTVQCRCVSSLISVRDMMVLEPQQEYDVDLQVPRVESVTTYSGVWQIVAQSRGLPPGEYFLRAAYTNAPDFAYSLYDVYEPGAAEIWEGRIEAPPVRYVVLPPDEARLQELISTIDGPGNADAAIRTAGLARASRAADALVRRFQRDPASRLRVIASLLAIADSDASNRLFDWLEGLPEQARNAAAFSAPLAPEPLSLLARTASGCKGARFIALSPSTEQDAIPSFVSRCPQYADEARVAIRTPDEPGLPGAASQEALSRRRSAIARLGIIGDPADLPLLLTIARGEQPAFLRRADRAGASTDLANHATAALRVMAWRHVSRVLREQLPEVVGNTPRDILLSGVHSALDRVPGERLQTLAPELFAAPPSAIVERASRLREAYPAQLARPTAPVIDVANATVREVASKLSDSRTDVQAAALDFLIEHGDSSLSARFVDLVDSPDEKVRERAIRAIERFGTASAFVPLRNSLVLRPDEIAYSVDTALRSLTFVDEFRGPSPPPVEEWDAWWRRNRDFTRRQWAEDVITQAKADPLAWRATPATRAVEYLAALPRPPYDTLERAARSRAWPVRVAASAAIARRDKPLGMQLLHRELANRKLDACQAAAEALQTIAKVSYRFDCGDPAQRERARGFWATKITLAD